MELASYILGKKSGGGSTPTGTINITENGTTNVTNYATANVNVQPDLETKSVTITENTTTTITPTTGKDGISSVSITTNVNPVDPKWTAMGFAKQVPGISDKAYELAMNIKNNWDVSTTEINYRADRLLLSYFPLVDTRNVTKISFNESYSLIAVAPINTSNVTNFYQGFRNCYGLIDVPVFDFSSVVQTSTSDGLNQMFSNCNSLSDQSLDNILQSCISANFSSTLKVLGFIRTKYPASRIQTLPHYQDFTNAGWEIGYTDE
jgi:hypothetical protein